MSRQSSLASSAKHTAETVYDIFSELTRDDDNEPELRMDPDLDDERGPTRGR
jgi:hypothetical protein